MNLNNTKKRNYTDFKDNLLIESSNIDKFNDLKKKKIDNQIDNLLTSVNNINFNHPNTNIEINNSIDKIELINILKSNNIRPDEKYKHRIEQIDELKSIILTNKLFTYDSLIILTNFLAKKNGEENIVLEKISNDQFQNIIWDNICFMLYPSYLLDPYIFDSDPNQNYVDTRTKSLEEICFNSKYFFPTWKKIYNYNIDYNYDEKCHIHKKICKRFTGNIFEFYENFYGIYFNIIFGEIFSWMFSKYKINLNPLDEKFNIDIFNKWANSFNEVIELCRVLIKNIANSIELEKIDELSYNDLIKLINKLNDDFIINFESIVQKDFLLVFKPMQTFFSENNNQKNNSNICIQIPWSTYSSKCLNNITTEIISVFRFKQYLKFIIQK